MQRLQDLSEQLREKKLTLGQAFSPSAESQPAVNTTTAQSVKEPKQQKVKVTAYLPIELAMRYNELCAERLAKDGHANKSNVICDAIELLYAQNKEEKS
jgi:hypothetical protein